MKQKNQDLIELSNDLTLAKTLQEIELVAARFVNAVGFKYFAYVHSSKDGSHMALSNYHPGMLHRLAALDENDPAVKHVRSGLPPGSWDERGVAAPEYLPVTRQAKRLMGEAGEQGMRAGITAPVAGPDLRWGILNVSIPVRTAARDVAPHIAEIYTLGAFMHSRILDLQEAAAPAKLTPREKDCLRLAEKGLTSHQIAYKLSISATSIDHHLHSASRKLGVRGRMAAVAAALNRGLI